MDLSDLIARLPPAEQEQLLASEKCGTEPDPEDEANDKGGRHNGSNENGPTAVRRVRIKKI